MVRHLPWPAIYTRSLKRTNYLITETNAEAIGWIPRSSFAYDGQFAPGCLYPRFVRGEHGGVLALAFRCITGKRPTGKVFSATTCNLGAFEELRAPRKELRKIGPEMWTFHRKKYK